MFNLAFRRVGLATRRPIITNSYHAVRNVGNLAFEEEMSKRNLGSQKTERDPLLNPNVDYEKPDFNDPEPELPDGYVLPPGWQVSTGYDGRTFYHHAGTVTSTYDLPDENTEFENAFTPVEARRSQPAVAGGGRYGRMPHRDDAYQRPIRHDGGKFWHLSAWTTEFNNSTAAGASSLFLFIFAWSMVPMLLGSFGVVGRLGPIQDKKEEDAWKAQQARILGADLDDAIANSSLVAKS